MVLLRFVPLLYPQDVLNKLFLIESYFKRTRKIRNEPRVIDLDLISYKNKIINNNKLNCSSSKNASKKVCH